MRIAREITGGGAAGLVLGLSLRIIVVLWASPRIPAIETAAPQLPQTTEDRAGSQMAADIYVTASAGFGFRQLSLIGILRLCDKPTQNPALDAANPVNREAKEIQLA